MAVTDEILNPQRRHASPCGPLPGSFAGQAGFMGARLGWHGWHLPVTSYAPMFMFDGVEILDTVS